jgi:hypothetical protein
MNGRGLERRTEVLGLGVGAIIVILVLGSVIVSYNNTIGDLKTEAANDSSQITALTDEIYALQDQVANMTLSSQLVRDGNFSLTQCMAASSGNASLCAAKMAQLIELDQRYFRLTAQPQYMQLWVNESAGAQGLVSYPNGTSTLAGVPFVPPIGSSSGVSGEWGQGLYELTFAFTPPCNGVPGLWLSLTNATIPVLAGPDGVLDMSNLTFASINVHVCSSPP